MDKDRTQKPHQNVQDKEKDESFNSIGHEDYHPIWLEDGTLYFIAHKNSHPKLHRGQIILNSH